MKTYLKGIKTVAVIFLSLALFSCQEEQIEPQDTLSTKSDQLMQRGGRVDFIVTLELYGLTGTDVLVSACPGTCNSKQTLLWFADPDENCGIITTVEPLGGEILYLNSIRPGIGSTDYTVFMRDGNGGDYRALFEGTDLVKLDYNAHYAYPLSQEPIPVFKKERKGKNVSWKESGTIRIGQIVIIPPGYCDPNVPPGC